LIDGGTHDMWNLILLCDSCHKAHHEGRLHIAGTADHLEVRRPAELRRWARSGEAESPSRAHVGTSERGTPDTCDGLEPAKRRQPNPTSQTISVAHHRPEPSTAIDQQLAPSRAASVGHRAHLSNTCYPQPEPR